MKTIVTSAAGWIVDDRPLWARLRRRWVFTMVERELKNGRLSDEGPRFPMGFLGARLIIKSNRIEARTPWGMLVVDFEGRKVKHAFLTYPNPDPFGVHHIHTWLHGAPPEVTKFVENRGVA